MRRIDTLIIHQTDTAGGTVESIRRWHMTQPELLWSDIGYHKVLYRDASIHQGRPDERVGAHCRGDNTGSLGICCVGKGPAKVGKAGGYMTKALWGALCYTVETLCRRHDIRVRRIYGHRERASGKRQGKTCPGFETQLMRDEMRRRGLT